MHRRAAVAHLHLNGLRRLNRVNRDPVHCAHYAAVSAGFGPGCNDYAIHRSVKADDVKGLAPGHTETFALTDGEVFDAVVLAHNGSVRKHDFPLPRGQIGIQERPHRSVVVSQAKILAFRFFCCAQTVSGGLEPCFGFGQFPQGKNDAPQNLLGQVVFPLGELTKPDTRLEATRHGLRTAEKPESQDLCLADHHGSMRAFLDAYLPPRQGEIVLSDGTVVGEHDGIEHFTIGQRKGLGVAWREPLHVIRLDAAMNRVVVAPRAEAGRDSCVVGAVNWVSIDPIEAPRTVEVQVRYRSTPVRAELSPLPATEADQQRERPHRCCLSFEEEQFSITPGQAAVFYDGDTVLGGGLIQRE